MPPSGRRAVPGLDRPLAIRPRGAGADREETGAGGAGAGRGAAPVGVADPIVSVAQRGELRRRSGAAVVDMESATAARLAAEHGLALTCLRAVSDDAGHELPPELATALAGGQVHPWRLAAAV